MGELLSAISCPFQGFGLEGLRAGTREEHPARYSVGEVHPIERLRYVARAGWAGPSVLAAEAAWAFADLAEREAPALVPACRRLLDRQPGCGPLWWVAARVLSAGDPVSEAVRCAQDLEDDPTPSLVLQVIPAGARAVRHGGVGEVASADLAIVEVEALGAGGMVTEASTAGLVEAARAAEVPIWLEGGVGRALPQRLWEAMASRMRSPLAAHPPRTLPGAHARTARMVPSKGHGLLLDHAGVEKVVGPGGLQSLASALASIDCPEPPELLEFF